MGKKQSSRTRAEGRRQPERATVRGLQLFSVAWRNSGSRPGRIHRRLPRQNHLHAGQRRPARLRHARKILVPGIAQIRELRVRA